MVTKSDRLIYDEVLRRDRMMTWWEGREFRAKNPWAVPGPYLASEPSVCAAPIIDPSQSGRCSGAMERDHVHTHTGGTKGKRPPTTMETLVILCHHHHQDGWATSHRPEIRIYIKEANERYRVLADRHLPG